MTSGGRGGACGVRRRSGRASPVVALLLVTVLAAACTPGSSRSRSPLPVRQPDDLPLHAPAFPAETVRVDTVAPGLLHRYYWAARGPWAIHLLDVDRSGCWSVVALKAGGRAVGRERTSALIRALADSMSAQSPQHNSAVVVGGGVNADFFTFVPPGVPIGLHASAGGVVAGPWTRPVLAFDSAGRPFVGTFAARGFVILGSDSLPVGAWNQRRGPGLALIDRAWGAVTDSATGALEVTVTLSDASRVSPVAPVSTESVGVVTAVDTLTAGVAIPPNGIVLTLGRDAPAELRRRLAEAGPGARVRWAVTLEPFIPREAVGGFPVLLRDSVAAADLDSAGGANFGPVRHPRTAVGIASGGRRLLLVTVDGRQMPYSDGMTLRELAAFFLALGVPTALNLDGGGSTTLVVREPSGALRIANRPSDREGERSVANALAVVGRCR